MASTFDSRVRSLTSARGDRGRRSLAIRALRTAGAIAALTLTAPTQDSPRRVPADGIEYQVTRWGTEDGLPQNNVQCITETRDTHLWVGTMGGLARFDGETFREVLLPESCGLGSIRFVCLHEQRTSGDLWLGTLGDGVVRRRNETYVRFGSEEGLPGDSVQAITSDGADVVWVATHRGVAWFDGEGFRSLPGFVELEFCGLTRRADGEVVLASSVGVFGLHQGGARRLSDVAAKRVTEDRRGRLWCAADRRVWIGEAEAWRELEVLGPPDLQIDSLCADRDGGVWFGTNCGPVRLADSPCVSRLDLSNVPPAQDPESAVRCIYEDRDAAIWIGWSMRGLQRVRPAQVQGVRLRARPEIAEAYVVAPDPAGGLWLGGHGLAHLHGDVLRSVPTPGLVTDDVRALLPEDDGLWFADDAGVHCLRAARVESLGADRGLPRGPKRALLRTGSGELWVACDRGLYALRGERFDPVAADVLGDRAVLALASGSGGDVWVGGARGVWRLQPDGRVVESYEVGNQLPPSEVRSLVPAGDDGAWVVTYGCGLLRISRGSVARIGGEHGLLDDALCAALIEGDDLFLNSNRGVFRCSLLELDAVAHGGISNVACQRLVGSPRVSGEGAGGNQPSACRDAEGALWFMTIDGIAGFAPGALKAANVPPPYCGIRGVVAGDDLCEPNGELVLRPGVRDLTVRLGASGFDPAVPPRFQWRFLERDASWRPLASGREVHIASLFPGEHFFEARSADWRGVWSQPAFLRVVVPELLTERAVFRVAAVIAFAALCAGLMLLGMRRGARRSRRLAHEVEARTAQLTAEVERHRTTTAELQAARDHLEERVRRRTDELVQHLQRQRQEESEREQIEGRMQHLQRLVGVGALAGGIAHDFNDLLTVVLGAASLLRRDAHDEEPAAALLEEILAAARRGSTLAQQLLLLSSRSVVAKAALDLNEVVPQLAPMLRRLLGDRIELAIQPAARPARVLAAPVHIEQMLRCLVDNARDALPDGGHCRVALQVGDGEACAGVVRVLVEDDGIGMDPQVRARAVDPFFSTKLEAGSAAMSVGLGLTAVAGIVRQLGGTLAVDSRVGGGTRVELVLPASDSVAGESVVPVPSRDWGPVLLVEDDPSVRHVVRLMLETLGHEVEAVASGDAALLALQRDPERYAVILSDLMMPGLHGVELACALRTAAPKASLVFMSGCWELLDTHQELLGPVLSKPPSLEALSAVFDRRQPDGRAQAR